MSYVTSTSEQRDDDVIIVTEDNIMPPDETRADENGMAESGRYGAAAETGEGNTGELASDDPYSGELTHDDVSDGPAEGHGTFAMPGGEPVTDEAVTDGPVTGEAVTDDPMTDEAATDETAADETVTDEPTAGEPLTGESASADETVAAAAAAESAPAGTATTESPTATPATTGAPVSAAADTQQTAAGTGAGGDPWPEIQARFVDDPRSAVEQAAEVTTGALTALMAAARNREQSLRDGWDADTTGTEELRTSLRDYRELAQRLSGLASQL